MLPVKGGSRQQQQVHQCQFGATFAMCPVLNYRPAHGLLGTAACLHNDIGLHVTISMMQQVLGCVIILYIPVGPCALL